MKVSAITPASRIIVIAGLCFSYANSLPATNLARNQNQQAVTPTTVASVVLDDPMNSATTNENTDTDNWDEICVRCYDKVKVTQDLIEIYDNILRKQKKLVNQKKAAAQKRAADVTLNANKQRMNKSNGQPNINNHNSTLTPRSLANQPELIVVSSLRVARSPSPDGQVQQQRWSNRDKNKLNKKDLELERLKRDQQRQKDTICKSLNDMHNCLEKLQQECIGNLHYHTYDVFYEQMMDRLRCPFNNPKMNPFPGLRKWIHPTDEDRKMPKPRDISSPEEYRKRLQELLPDRVFPRPIGVMLKPTMPNPATQQQMQSIETMKGSYRHLTQPRYMGGEDSLTLGRVLLVPACFAILVALVAALYKISSAPEKKDDGEEQS
jgi:hypothetical protein